MCGLMPVVRIEANRYMVGTEAKAIVMKADKMLVRVGGGFDPLENVIDRTARPECLKINFRMRQ